MKGTYVFEQGAAGKVTQTMILDDLKLYIPQGHQYELATFDDEKVAAQAFNRVMMARFTPRAGWRIIDKRMGEATTPPLERMVGYVPPAVTTDKANLATSPVHLANDHLLIAVETAADADLAGALSAHRETVRHLCMYARFKATPGLAALLKNPWPGLQTLVVDAFDQTATRQATCRVGDLSAVLPVVPDVSRLYVAGQLGFGAPVTHASLAHLSLLGNPLPSRALAVLAASSLPALARLDLGLATEAAPDAGWLEQLVVLLQAARRLEVLTLEGPMDATDVLRALAPLGQKLPRQLRIMASARDEDALVSAAAALADSGAAPALVLRSGELVAETLAALRRLLPSVEEALPAAFLPDAYGSARFRGEVV